MDEGTRSLEAAMVIGTKSGVSGERLGTNYRGATNLGRMTVGVNSAGEGTRVLP